MASAEAQRRWRARTRASVVEALGGFCYGCGANGTTRLELAHKIPARRTRPWREGMDKALASVRANPFGYLLLCRPCHKEYDGPAWRPRDA